MAGVADFEKITSFGSAHGKKMGMCGIVVRFVQQGVSKILRSERTCFERRRDRAFFYPPFEFMCRILCGFRYKEIKKNILRSSVLRK